MPSAPLKDILSAFSLLQNIRFILSTKKVGSDRVDCLEGIRALSMTWVVLRHSFAFSLPLLFVNNREFTIKIQKDGQVGLAFQSVTQGEYAVDTFFFLPPPQGPGQDGRLGWQAKTGPHVNRILRITVPYAFWWSGLRCWLDNAVERADVSWQPCSGYPLRRPLLPFARLQKFFIGRLLQKFSNCSK